MKSEKNSARNLIVSTIRHASLELSNLANEIEQIGELSKVENKLQRFPNILLLIRKSTWELQNARLDKAFELMTQVNDEIASEKLADIEVA